MSDDVRMLSVSHTLLLFNVRWYAGNQTAYGANPKSDANNQTVWTGQKTLPYGYYNITVEYHNGNGSGSLTVRSGFNPPGPQYNVSVC